MVLSILRRDSTVTPACLYRSVENRWTIGRATKKAHWIIYAKYAKILDICKRFSKNLVNERFHIRLEVPYRLNQKDWKPTFIPFAKARKRIETDFSQFVGQFMPNRNFAKQPEGLFARVISKIASFTTLQYVNYLSGKPIGHIKYALD